jgi:hypothetical protein
MMEYVKECNSGVAKGWMHVWLPFAICTDEEWSSDLVMQTCECCGYTRLIVQVWKQPVVPGQRPEPIRPKLEQEVGCGTN